LTIRKKYNHYNERRRFVRIPENPDKSRRGILSFFCSDKQGVLMANFYIQKEPKSYGFFKFMGDVIMTVLTGGLWLIWIFVREMRGR
jgi:hypothetical protein